MDWKTMLTCITGSVDRELLLRNEYLVTENRILRDQLQGRLRLTDGERRPWPRSENSLANELWKSSITRTSRRCTGSQSTRVSETPHEFFDQRGIQRRALLVAGFDPLEVNLHQLSSRESSAFHRVMDVADGGFLDSPDASSRGGHRCNALGERKKRRDEKEDSTNHRVLLGPSTL